MPRYLAALLSLILAAAALPAAGRQVVYETVIETVEYEYEAGDAVKSERFLAATQARGPAGIATFGPFRVLDESRAAIVDQTDSASPAQFAAMLRSFPRIAMLELIEVPGTQDDRANLRLGRMIRAAGISTHVPDGGSVRSGGVELFLAGVRHTAAPRAEFAVHSWADEDGREARHYPVDAPENRAYLTYYREMGMDESRARAFYAMTNAVPFAQARWLSAADMGQWVAVN
jgi:hypothetical protein